jgi:hypothetical protein
LRERRYKDARRTYSIPSDATDRSARAKPDRLPFDLFVASVVPEDGGVLSSCVTIISAYADPRERRAEGVVKIENLADEGFLEAKSRTRGVEWTGLARKRCEARDTKREVPDDVRLMEGEHIEDAEPPLTPGLR